jgi:hypothetical protein
MSSCRKNIIVLDEKCKNYFPYNSSTNKPWKYGWQQRDCIYNNYCRYVKCAKSHIVVGPLKVWVALTMEAARTSETSVDIQLTTRQYIPEDSELHTRRRENLKSHTSVLLRICAFISVVYIVWNVSLGHNGTRKSQSFIWHLFQHFL